mgnify:CR=1 FL=1
MSLVAPIEDGKLVSSTTGTTGTATQASNSAESMDKEAFLQLLVAQMKYQDPLQPTSNTEYISQYAQFSQVESLQNMSSGMDLQRASGMVGQTVYVKATAADYEKTDVKFYIYTDVYKYQGWNTIDGKTYYCDQAGGDGTHNMCTNGKRRIMSTCNTCHCTVFGGAQGGTIRMG